VGGRDEGEPGIDFSQQICLEAALVDGNRSRHGASRGEDRPCHGIARILDDEPVARVEQEPCAQIQTLLRAVDDDDLFRIAPQSSSAPEIRLQCFAQPSRATRILIGQTVGPLSL
jgi:hypothetical protein